MTGNEAREFTVRKGLVLAACCAALAAFAVVGAMASGNRVFVRRVFSAQVLTDAGTSNSTSVKVSDYTPIGWFGVELHFSGTGTVEYIKSEVSNDDETWHEVASVLTNQAVSGGAKAEVVYTRLAIPPAAYVRLTGKTSADTVTVDGWIVVH